MSDDLSLRAQHPDAKSDATLSIILRAICGALQQKRCTSEFQVTHITDSGNGIQVMSRLIDVNLPMPEQLQLAREVATEFNEATLTHVKAHRMPQMYAVNGFKKNGEPTEAMPFRQFPPADSELAGLSVSPTDKGVMTLMQEMTLGHASHGYRARSEGVELLERMLQVSEARADKMGTRAERLQDKCFDLSEKYEALLTKMHDRDREREKGEILSRQGEKLMMAAMFLGKIACERWGIEIPQGAFEAFMSTGGADDKDDPVTALKTKVVLEKLTTLLQSLTPEQQMTIIGCLDEKQAAVFAEGFKMMLAAAAAKPAPAAAAVKVVEMTTPTPVSAPKPPHRNII